MATADTVTITHEPREGGGRYIARIAGEAHTGHLDWEAGDNPGIRIATHTIVPPAIGGRGIAALLVGQLVADARAQGFRIVPQCSYVARKFDANPDLADLRA